MKKKYISGMIGFCLALAVICLLVANNLFSAPPDTSYPLFPQNSQVKNIILLIGDGMGMTQITAARIKAFGADGRLQMEKMPVTGLQSTHSADRLVTDSAAAGTALATGYKTNTGMIAMSPEGKRLLTILEACRVKGMATGLVATSTITHATPAAFAAHVKFRRDEATIATHLLENRVNVLLGGGKAFFIPQSEMGSKRRDERNLIVEAKKIGYTFVQTKRELKLAKGNYLLGLFQHRSLTTTGGSREPTLAEMAQKAIELLSRNEKGFFLMVEGSQIDWACHSNLPGNAIRQTLLFDEAVKVALDFALKDKHTLVIVTADHETGGMAIKGGSLGGKDLDIGWTTKEHTAEVVPIYAFGPKAEQFMGSHDNTDIPKIFAKLLGIKSFPRVSR